MSTHNSEKGMSHPNVASEAKETTTTAGETELKSHDTEDIGATIAGTEAIEYDPAEGEQVLRKIDRVLMPTMLIGYGLVIYDKAILGFASLLGMGKDLKLIEITPLPTGGVSVNTMHLSWATSAFYFGILAGLYPLTFVVQKFSLGRVLATVIFVWGVTCMSTAAVTTYQGLYVQRFFLGFIESTIPTCFMCVVSNFYTQREQGVRQSFWLSGTGIFTILGGALNYGFSRITGGNLHSWQYIYLLAGVLTILWSFWTLAMPTSPATAWFLSNEHRLVAVERLRRGQGGMRCETFKSSHILEGLLDVKTWLIFVMMATAYMVNGLLSGFGPLIVSTFGYSNLESVLLQFPGAAVSSIFQLITGYLGFRYQNIRLPMVAVCCLPIIGGAALMWQSAWYHRAPAPIIGFVLIGFFGPVVSLTITVGMSNVAGQTKKSFMAATIFVAYCLGNVVGPQLVKSQTVKKHYPELFKGIIISYCLTMACAMVLYVHLRLENKKRASMGLNEADRDAMAFMDLTDKKNMHFRYSL